MAPLGFVVVGRAVAKILQLIVKLVLLSFSVLHRFGCTLLSSTYSFILLTIQLL